MMSRAFRWLFVLFFSAWIACVEAKPIQLYLEPNPNSKMIEIIQSEKGVILIFQPKNSEWVKVANPENGNVGWVKQSDLSDGVFHLQMMESSGSKGNSTNVFQFGNMTKEQKESMNAMFEKMEKRRQAVQKEMQRHMDEMFVEMKEFWNRMPEFQMSAPVQSKEPADKKNPLPKQVVPASGESSSSVGN